MAKVGKKYQVDRIIREAVMERARREIEAMGRGGPGQGPDTANLKERRLRASDEQARNAEPRTGSFWGFGSPYGRSSPLRRTARDSVPPRSVVTDAVYRPPHPRRPMPGSSAAEIMAWNVWALALSDEERMRELGY